MATAQAQADPNQRASDQDKAEKQSERLMFRAHPTITPYELARVLEISRFWLPAEQVPRELRRHFESQDERAKRVQAEAEKRAQSRRGGR
jgi:hypothetical protein